MSTTEIRMWVTPELALEWLTDPLSIGANRRVNEHRVDRWAAIMERDEWRYTGEAIKFSTDGKLLDGQHRLHACVKSGRPFEVLVVRGLEETARDVMDTGRPRRASDVLEIHGYKHANTVAAAAKILVNMENGSFSTGTLSGRQIADNLDVLDYVKRNDDIMTAIDRVGTSKRPCNPSVYLAAFTLMQRCSPEDVGIFDAAFTSGAGLHRGDAVLALRERLIMAQAKREKLSQYAVVSALLRCWNAWRAGQSMNKFAMYHGGGPIPIPDTLR